MNELPDSAERRAALRDFEHDLVVRAGAGTGKTSLLVGRLVSALLRHHVEPSRTLALTFTENAASELQERVVALLRAVEGLRDGAQRPLSAGDRTTLESLALDASHAERAGRLADDADLLPIATFHGFCLQFLQRHARRLGMPVRIELADRQRLRPAFDAAFLDFLGARSGPELERALARFPFESLRELAWELLAQPADAEQRGPDLLELESLAREAEQLLAAAPTARPGWRGLAREAQAACHALLRAEVPTVASRAPYLERRVPAPGKREVGDAALAESLHERLNSVVRRLAPLVAGDDEATAWALAFVAPFVAAERERRKARGVLTFDDLLLLTREALLHDGELRDAAGAGLTAILVDEFQDTDPLQYDVVFLLAARPGLGRVTDPLAVPRRKGALFIVGDVKQSIYRFRRADIAAFLRVVQRLESAEARSLGLSANFRSRPEVLDFANRVCAESIRHEPPFQHGYEPVAATRAPDAGARVELVRLELGADVPAAARREREGEAIVAEIQALRAEGHAYGDVAVLLRAASQTAWLLRPLRRARVPYVIEGGLNFYARHEVVFAGALVRAVAVPHDPAAVLAVLRSALSRATDAQIAGFLAGGGSLDYRVAADDRGPVGEGLRRLASWHEHCARLPVDRALRELLLGAAVVAAEATGFEGAQRLANLELLVERTLAARPLDLAEAAERMLEHGRHTTEEQESPLFDASQQAVRVLTVHKSKGLEFPFVIVPDLARPLEVKESAPGPVRVERVLAAGGGAQLAVRIDAASNGARLRVESERRRHAVAEQRRLFYVAATRAQERLILIAPASARGRAVWLEDVLAVFPASDPAWRPARRAGEGPAAEPRGAEVGRVHAAVAEFERHVAGARGPARAVVAPSSLGAEAPGAPTALALGRVLHGYLAAVDLRRTQVDACLLEGWLAAELGIAPETRERALAAAAAFHASRLRERLVAAREVAREHPVAWRAKDGTVFSGMIDALVIAPDGGLLVLDYKTERLAGRDAAQCAGRYRPQLEAYAEGVRKALRLVAPPRCAVHFVVDDVTVEVARGG